MATRTMVTPSWLIDHAPGRAVLNGVRQRTPETRACGAEERSVGVPCSGLRACGTRAQIHSAFKVESVRARERRVCLLLQADPRLL